MWALYVARACPTACDRVVIASSVKPLKKMPVLFFGVITLKFLSAFLYLVRTAGFGKAANSYYPEIISIADKYMCSRFDLNSDIRAFQMQLGLDMEDIRRMVSHGGFDDARHTKANDADNADSPENSDTHAPERADDINAAFDDLIGTKRPTDPIAVILPNRKAAIRHWGLTGGNLTAPLINARAETLDQKPIFRPLLARRCLIPATAWYEWRKDGSAKHKNRITLPDHQPFLFAGLENGSEATIITCAPSHAIAHIHNRMPVVIGPNHINGWLDPSVAFADTRHMLTALPDHVLSWHEETPTALKTKRDDDQISLFSK